MESGSEPLSVESELLARGREPWRNDDRALEHLRPEEGLHQLVVGAVTEHLRLDAYGGGVFDRDRWPLAGEPPFEDPLAAHQ